MDLTYTCSLIPLLATLNDAMHSPICYTNVENYHPNTRLILGQFYLGVKVLEKYTDLKDLVNKTS